MRSDAGPVINVTISGVVLYIRSPTAYPRVMGQLVRDIESVFCGTRGPLATSEMSRIVKYAWVLRVKDII